MVLIMFVFHSLNNAIFAQI